MEASDNSRVYQALPSPRHIRLLRVLPGAHDDPITVSLLTVALDDGPQYEAISYVWGDPSITETIICDDAVMSIRKNLHSALHRFRQVDEPRTLWADALCINQQDLDERAEQVQIMHLIYKSCTMCLVWLGPSDEHSEIGLDIVDDIAKIVSQRLGVGVEELDNKLLVTGRDARLALDIGFANNLPSADSTKWGSLFHFMCRDWFSRVWVIQECHFAKSVLFFCGHRTTTYASLYHTADWILTNGNSVSYEANLSMAQYMISTRYNIMRMRSSNWERDNRTLKSLLDTIKSFHASDLRDKIYALIHLPPFRREHPDISVDYRADARDVYIDVAWTIIKHEKGLELLTTVDRDAARPEEGLPSWVPRWHRLDTTPNVSSMWYQFFSAGTVEGAPALAVDCLNGDVLSVTGFELDSIEDVCRFEFHGTYMTKPPPPPIFHVDEPWTPYTRSPDGPYATEPDFIAAYAMTLTASCRGVGGWWARRCPEDEFPLHASDFVAWLQWLRTAGNVDGAGSHYPPGLYSQERPFLNDTTEEEMLDFSSRYQEMVRRYNLNRRLFRTKKGYLGLGAHGLAKGDKVCIVAGGAIPLLMRPRTTGQGYELIGDAYVHGVMYGEATSRRMQEENGTAWSAFDIV